MPSTDSSTDWCDRRRLTSLPRRSTDQQPPEQLVPALVRGLRQLLPTTRTSPCRVSSRSGMRTWAGPSGCKQRVGRIGPASVNGHDGLKTKPGNLNLDRFVFRGNVSI